MWRVSAPCYLHSGTWADPTLWNVLDHGGWRKLEPRESCSGSYQAFAYSWLAKGRPIVTVHFRELGEIRSTWGKRSHMIPDSLKLF